VSIDSNIIPPVASINTQLSPGADNITVQYSGDANYLASTSVPALVSVGQTFTLAANPTSITVSKPGQSGSTTLTFTAQNGFTGSATLTGAMCSNLPSESSCSFSPTTISLTSGTTSVPVALTVKTTAPSSRAASGATRRSLVLWGFQGTLALGICFLSLSPHRRRLNLVLVALLAVIAVSCGGGSSSVGSGGTGSGGGGTGGGGGNSDPGTPVGTYYITVTVTINGVTQSINNLSVNVQ